MPRRIAYIMSRFPKLSETFILREMIALNESDWDVQVYPLILERTPVVHPEALPWLEKVTYFPWVSGEILISNMKEFFKNPLLYISLCFQVLMGNLGSLKFLIRAVALFPKTIHIARHMEKNQIAHIHAHYATHPALMAWLIYKLVGISYSVTVHAHDIFVSQSMLSEKLKCASFIVAISEFNRQFLIRYIGDQISKKIHVVRCGIDPDLYSGENRQIASGKFKILSIGSLQPYKGMKYLIHACAILKEKGIPFQCKIVGAGEEYADLEGLIAKLELFKFVELVGAKTQGEVAKMLREADCYVQPSVITPSGKMEGIPVALMEALATKLPVIASHLSGIPELVLPNETGYLVQPENPTSLADTIIQVYYHYKEAKKMAIAGHKLVRSEYSIKTNSAQLAKLFSEQLALL